MPSLKEALQNTVAADDAALFNAAVTVLKRANKSPANALAPFIGRLRVSPEVRALIGADLIRDKALVYLEARAADMKNNSSSSKEESGGGAQSVCDSQRLPGSAAAPSIPVVAHRRHRPGNARRGLVEVQAAANVAPNAFMIMLSDGRDFKKLKGFEVRRIVPNTAYDFALSIQAQRFAQFDDNAIVGDFLPDDMLREHGEKAKRFAALVTDGVSITIDAFLQMEMRQIEHAA
jgi:hypothetical protein